jgi:hypothetical protein
MGMADFEKPKAWGQLAIKYGENEEELSWRKECTYALKKIYDTL